MSSELIRIVENSPHAPGLALIFSCDYKSQENYPDLTGAEKDGQNMEKSLKSLGYAVKRMHNFTRGDLQVVLFHAAESVHYPSSYKRIVFVFSGHGEQGELITNEGKAIDVGEVVKKLSPTSSSSQLKNMVRLFFIDACRGNKDDIGLMVDKGGTSKDSIRIPRDPANFLLAFSTVSGCRSYEERARGGLWMSLVAEMLPKYNGIIQGVLTTVNEELMKKMQDQSSYPCMQQPEKLDRLNENVNLFAEKPAQQDISKEEPSLPIEQPVDDVQIMTPASALRHQRPPEKTLSRSNKPGRQCCIAANFSGSPSDAHTLAIQRSTSQPYFDHQKPVHVVPSLCRQTTSPLPSHNTELVARKEDVVKVHSPPSSGVYRSKLNIYQQSKQILSYTWCDEEKKNHMGGTIGFISCVEAALKDGRKIECSSQHVFSTKAASREAAATNVIGVIDKMLASSSIDHLICIGAESLVYKQKLNNMMQGSFHTQLPDYVTRRLGEQQFQCTVRHSMFGEVTGSVCNSKKEAENVAAYRAYSCYLKK